MHRCEYHLCDGSRCYSTRGTLARQLKLEVRSQLEDYWKFHRKGIIFRQETKTSWLHSDSMRTLNKAAPQLNPAKLKHFCDQPTTLYISSSAQRDNICPMIIFGCIYKQWFLYYNNEPNIEFGHVFANPVCITSSDPMTVVDRSHKLLYDQASRFLNRLDRGEDIYPYCTLSTENYKLRSFCRAVILILEELDQNLEGDEDGRVSLDEYSQAQRLLMV